MKLLKTKMRNLLFITLLISFPNLSFGQLVDGFVYDSESNEPLPYSSVGTKSGTSGFQTDTTGYFQLKIGKNDTILITFVGFKPHRIVNLPTDSIINLGIIKIVNTGASGYATVVKKKFLSKKTKLKCVPFNNVKKLKPEDLIVYCFDNSFSYKWEIKENRWFELDYQSIKFCE